MAAVIAVTGATGFAGRHVVAELLRRGHAVRALARDPSKAGLPEGVELVAGDLSNISSLATLVRDAGAMIHVAGAIAAPSRASFHEVNETGAFNVASAAAKAGVRRFMHVSSLSARLPAISDYAASKKAGEDAVEKVAANMSLAILRPPAVYGPGDKATLPLFKALTQTVALVPGTASARFSLIYVEDLARALADAAMDDWQGIRTISDGREGGYRWPDLLGTVAALEGRAPKIAFLPKPLVSAAAAAVSGLARMSRRTTIVSPGKIAELYHRDWVCEAELKVAAPVQFEDGFRRTLSWYRKEGWLPPSRLAARSAGHRETLA
jgi:nucleoside-diphosphate-sugar epimerase